MYREASTYHLCNPLDNIPNQSNLFVVLYIFHYNILMFQLILESIRHMQHECHGCPAERFQLYSLSHVPSFPRGGSGASLHSFGQYPIPSQFFCFVHFPLQHANVPTFPAIHPSHAA